MYRDYFKAKAYTIWAPGPSGKGKSKAARDGFRQSAAMLEGQGCRGRVKLHPILYM